MQQYVPRRARVGFLQLRLQPEFADQVEQRGRALKALRAGFEKQAGFFDGINHAAGRVVCFKNGDVQAQPLQAIRAGQAGYSGSNHGYS